MELKVKIDDTQLRQAINYFDWALEHLSWIHNAYKSEEINDKEYPRVILVAPDFSDSLITEAKYLDDSEYTDISLYRYTVLKEKKKLRIVTMDVDIPTIQAPPEPPKTIEEITSWIDEEEIQALFVDTIQKIESINSTILKKILGRRIVFAFNGKNFCALHPRKHYILLEWKEPGEWRYEKNIKDIKAVGDVLGDKSLPTYLLVGGTIPD